KKSDWFMRDFALLEKTLNGESKSPVHTLRKDALARFVELGFPTTRHEEWRFTNIAPIRNTEFHSATESSDAAVNVSELNHLFLTGPRSFKLVFVNGHFAGQLSNIPVQRANMKVGSLASAMKDGDRDATDNISRIASFKDNAFVALSTAFLRDGAFLCLGDDVVVDDPIECVFIATGKQPSLIASPRNLFLVGRNSKATIVESYVGPGAESYLNNVVTEVVVGENASVEHDKLVTEGPHSYHIGTTFIHQAGGSSFINNAVALSGAIVRNNITVILAGQGADATLNGLSLGTGDQLIDNHTTIDHTMPHCTSHELYKSILDGKARGVFNGKIFVREDAQKTDAKQTNKTLLLSDDATINTKPQLEIFADDVKCTHGATVGQLDEEQVFYLRSRGIGEVLARDILTSAFASDVVERIHSENLKSRLQDLIRTRLEEGRNARN
ncbi:MAG TPA: Fe-S cluster assembly protein SufD, partial [Bacteroidota bacterium]